MAGMLILAVFPLKKFVLGVLVLKVYLLKMFILEVLMLELLILSNIWEYICNYFKSWN